MRKLSIDNAVLEKIADIQSTHDFKKESGGILIGLFDARLDAIRITDMSFPFPTDQRSRFRFSRKSNGHQEYMDDLWEKSERTKSYFGEWHTHDQDNPVPSLTDRNTWKRISKRDNNFTQCFFLIIGRKNYRIWTIYDESLVEVEVMKNGERK